MNTMGTHLIADAWQAPPELLNDPEHIKDLLKRAVRAGGATLINLCVHQFSPHGVTATATLAESHIAIHTWPEHGYFAVDLFFCGAGDPEAALRTVLEGMRAGAHRSTLLDRGFPAQDAAAVRPLLHEIA